MRTCFRLIIPAAFVLFATPCLAAYDNTWPGYDYGTWPSASQRATHQSDALLFVMIAVPAVLAVILIIIRAAQALRDESGLPRELQPTQSPEHYDQQAARTRALARKLDAETNLAETKLRTSLKEDDLKQFELFLRDKKSPARRK